MHLLGWELKKGCVGWRWDGQRSLGRVSFLLGCVCVCVCRAEGGLHGHNQASNVALLFLTKRPLHLVFNRAATIVLNRISSLHIV